MTNSSTLPVIGAAVAAPALLPALATIAPPLLLGAGIAAALVWLFSEDQPQTATVTPGNEPPAPNPAPRRIGLFPVHDDKPAAQAPAPAMTEAERQQRARELEVTLASERRELERLNRQHGAERQRA